MASVDTRERDPFRHASVADIGTIPVPCTAEFIARLPRVDPADPMPLDVEKVMLLVPGYDPWRDAEGFHFDRAAATRAILYFTECLQHTKGELAGQPLTLELWEQALIANAFGWMNESGNRRYREVFLYVPRKNGKTTLCAGVVLLLLFCDGEPGAEIYSAAAEQKQAALVFDQASDMVHKEPELATRGRVYRALKSIEFSEFGSVYRAISADAKTKHGFNTHAFVMDELHAQRNSDLLDALDTSMGARRQPMAWIITTADFAGESICNTKLDFAKRVRDGVIEDSAFLPAIYCLESDDDWNLEANWRKANPNFGISIRREEMERQHRKARQSLPFQNTFKRLRLNITTQADVAAINIEDFDRSFIAPSRQLANDHKGGGTPRVLTDADLEGYPCWGGLDLASVKDLAAFALWWPTLNVVRIWYWLPQRTARHAEDGRNTPYSAWAMDPRARLTLTPGNAIDYDKLRVDILRHASRYKPVAIGFDRWNSAQIVSQLMGDGLDMIAFGQGFASMSNPTKELLRLIATASAGHDGCPVTRFNATNLMLEEDAAGNVKPSKRRSREKIDGMVAWIIALGVSVLQPDKGPSVYEGRGIRTL